MITFNVNETVGVPLGDVVVEPRQLNQASTATAVKLAIEISFQAHTHAVREIYHRQKIDESCLLNG